MPRYHELRADQHAQGNPTFDHRAVVAAFQRGQVDGLDGMRDPPRHVVTQVSHLFFTDSHVYKLCRADNDAFNRAMFDFSAAAARAAFLREDFALNRYFSPTVYIALFGVRREDGVARAAPDGEGAVELVIQMRRIDPASGMTSRLLRRGVTGDMALRAGRWLAGRVAEYPLSIGSATASFAELMNRRVADVAAFCGLGAPSLAEETASRVVLWLSNECRRLAPYLAAPPGGLVVGVDCHSDNFFIDGEDFFLLDAFQIKPGWRLVDPLLNICRLGTDLRVLGKRELFASLLRGFRERYPQHPLPADVVRFYVVYAALIRVVLWIDAGRPDLAWRYLECIGDSVA